MTRNMRSAKQAGAMFERTVADYLAKHVDMRIDRRVSNGARDRGDIGGVRHGGRPVVVECKNSTRLDLAGWSNQAEVERGNDDALAGLVVHKRHGVASPGDQWVTMTLRELAAILTFHRPEGDEAP